MRLSRLSLTHCHHQELIAWQFSNRSPSKHEEDQREDCDQLCLTIAYTVHTQLHHCMPLNRMTFMCFLLYFELRVWEHCKIKNPFPILCPDLVMNLYSINVSTKLVQPTKWINGYELSGIIKLSEHQICLKYVQQGSDLRHGPLGTSLNVKALTYVNHAFV